MQALSFLTKQYLMLSFEVINLLFYLNFVIMNREKMVDSLGNQEQILLWVAGKYDIKHVSRLLADGYTLTTDVLEVLCFLGYSSEQILDCLKSCRYYSDAKLLFDWLCGFIGQEKTEAFLISEFEEDFDLFQYFSLESLEKYQCWNELARRKADDILFKHEQYDKMSPEGLYKYKLFDEYFKKYGHINPEDNAALDYLAEKGLWNIVQANYNILRNTTNQKLLDFLVKHKKFEMIATQNVMYLTKFPEGIEYLQKNKRYFILAEAKLYDKVDWDDYLQSGKNCPVAHAEEAQQWDALMRNHKHLVLLRHFKLWRFIKSFF